MSLPSYPEYKPSGVEWLGEVPRNWEVKRFKQIFKERDERSDDGLETLLSVSAYTGVSPRSELVEEGEHLSRADSLEGYKICHPNDLVMNIMLAWNRGLAFSDYDGIVSPAYGVFQVIDDSFPKFLNYLVRTDLYTLYFKAFSSGVIDSRLRLYPVVFGSLSCGLPSIEEQQTITAFLDRETGKIDALIAEQQRLVELLAEKRQVVISHAVTKGLNPNAKMKDSGIAWLGEVPEHWEVSRIKYVAKIGNGSTPSRDNLDYWTDGDYPWLNSSVVNQDKITEAEQFVTRPALKECHLPIITPPVVLVGITGQGRTRGMAATLMFEATINQHVAFVKPDECRLHIDFLRRVFDMAYQYLRTESDGAGSTKGAITCEQIARLEIPLPSLSEQKSIAAFLETEAEKFDTLTAEANRVIALLQERRSALISAAVTGKIDVRENG